MAETQNIATTHPDTPSTYLQIRLNSSRDDPVVWRLEWGDDTSSVEWTALPAKGLAYPGETMKVMNSYGYRWGKYWRVSI